MINMEVKGVEQEVVYEKQPLSPRPRRSCHAIQDAIKETYRHLALLKAELYQEFPHYKKSHTGVAPNLRKSFPSKASLLHFFATMKPCASKDRLLLQFFYALRVGEVKTVSYNPFTKLVRVETEKEGRIRIDYLPFIEGTERLFSVPLVSDNCLRNFFYRHCKRLGPPYHDIYHAGKTGDLNRLTSHSLRVTASNGFREYTGDPYKQKVYLRHNISRAYGATSHYMEYSEDDFRSDLNGYMKEFVKSLL